METKKGNAFCMILYKDSVSYDYNSIINYITKNYDKYAYIEHEQEEEDKKPHTHVVFYFNNKRYPNAIAKNDFNSNTIDLKLTSCHLIPMLRYLIHYDNEEKKQYSIENVKGTLVDKLEKAIKGKQNEIDYLSDILRMINECKCKITFNVIFNYCIEFNYISAYLRYYAIIRDIIVEHNQKYLT
jgi:hypothetical protein